MNSEEIQKFNKFRKVCLNNSEEFLTVANFALKSKIDHVAFHLTTLALEEIGKIELFGLELMIKSHKKGIATEMNLDLDDHVKKLFWAIWGQSFGREKITSIQINEQRGLAQSIHKRRLLYLYADPEIPLSGREKMEVGEAKMLYDFVNSRYQLESVMSGWREEIPEIELVELEWFHNATNDNEKRKYIFGNQSQDKLVELGDVKKWISWLKEIYDKHDAEMTELAKLEIARAKPETELVANEPKWRVKIRIITPSHSIKDKFLNEFNNHSDFIKLHKVNSNELSIDLFFPKAVPVATLWDQGWIMSRIFVVSLNIATRGFFWWKIPIDTARYYEEIWDIEKNIGVRVEVQKHLVLNWREMRWVLDSAVLSLSSILFGYITNLFKEHKTKPIEAYIAGMSLFAKNDIHLRVEPNALEQFYIALKLALLDNGEWDGKSDLNELLHKRLEWYFEGKEKGMKDILAIGAEIESTHRATKEITITEVVAMKTYCDLYLLTVAKEQLAKKLGKDVQIVVGKVNAE